VATVNVRVVAVTVASIGGVVGALIGVYALLPTQQHIDNGWVLRLFFGTVLTALGVWWQLHAIGRSRRPLIRAVRALVVIVMIFLIAFSLTYVAMSQSNPKSFTEPLDKVSAFYFTMTTLATVGYGDIAPVTDAARIVVTVQEALDLLVIAVTTRVLLRAASGAVERRTSSAADTSSAAGTSS
jgi:voltage-gated potassium channel